jgi:ribosomal protein L7/L12
MDAILQCDLLGQPLFYRDSEDETWSRATVRGVLLNAECELYLILVVNGGPRKGRLVQVPFNTDHINLEPFGFIVQLRSGGANKIQVIKAIREATGYGLKEAKDAVDFAPTEFKLNQSGQVFSADEAHAFANAIETVGGTAEVKGMDK